MKPHGRACLKLLSINPFNQRIRSFHLGDPVRVKVTRINAFRSETDYSGISQD